MRSRRDIQVGTFRITPLIFIVSSERKTLLMISDHLDRKGVQENIAFGQGVLFR